MAWGCRNLHLSLVIATLLAGCGDPPSEEAPSEDSAQLEEGAWRSMGGGTDVNSEASQSGFVARDSGEIVVAETEGAVARTPLPWTLSSIPILEIGSTTGDPAYLLSQVTGAGQMDDGTIFLIDGSSKQLRFYDSKGFFLHSAGRQGEGPGEFRNDPLLVRSSRYAAVTVFDPGLQRFSRGQGDGKTLLTLPTLVLIPTHIPSSQGEIEVAAISSPAGFVGDGVLTSHTMSVMSPDPGLQPPAPFEFRITHSETGASRVVARFVRTRLWRTAPPAASTPGGMAGPSAVEIPFFVPPMAVGASDRFYLNSGDSSEIQEFDESGILRRIVRLNESAQALTEVDRRRFIDGRLSTLPNESLRASLRGAFEEAPLPATMPAWQSLLVDEVEWLWVERYRMDGSSPNLWMVFDREGRAHGTIELPTNFRVHQVGDDFILGVARDDLGVEYLRIYRLTRS